MPWDVGATTPPEIAGPTRRFDVPFELIEESRATSAPARVALPSDDFDVDVIPSDDIVGDVGDATSKFSLDELLSGTGDTLVLGDPTAIVETAVVRRTSSSGEAEAPTRICIGKDLERFLSAATVLRVKPGAPAVEFSPFERFIVAHLSAPSSVADLADAGGLTPLDLRIALALLADKGQIEVVEPSAPALVDPAAIGLSFVDDHMQNPWDVPSSAPPPIAVSSRTLVSRSFGPSSLLRQVQGAAVSGLSALEQYVHAQLSRPKTPLELAASTGLSESDLKLALEQMIRTGAIARDEPLTRPARPPSSPPTTPAPLPRTTTGSVPAAATLPRTPTRSTPAPTKDPAKDIRVRLSRALGLEERGDLQGAVNELRALASVASGDAAVWNRLGVLLARVHDLPGAHVAFTKALAIAPADAAIASNHARIAALAAQVRVTRGKRPGV